MRPPLSACPRVTGQVRLGFKAILVQVLHHLVGPIALHVNDSLVERMGRPFQEVRRVKICTQSWFIILHWNVGNPWHPCVGDCCLRIQSTSRLMGVPRVPVCVVRHKDAMVSAKSGPTTHLHHSVPHRTAMVPGELPTRRNHQHRDYCIVQNGGPRRRRWHVWPHGTGQKPSPRLP